MKKFSHVYLKIFLGRIIGDFFVLCSVRENLICCVRNQNNETNWLTAFETRVLYSRNHSNWEHVLLTQIDLFKELRGSQTKPSKLAAVGSIAKALSGREQVSSESPNLIEKGNADHSINITQKVPQHDKNH